MSAIENAIAVADSRRNVTRSVMKSIGATSLGGTTHGAYDSIAGMQTQRQYQLYRGWVHSCIHAIGEAACSQPMRVAKKKKSKIRKPPGKMTKKTWSDKQRQDNVDFPNEIWEKTPAFIRTKRKRDELKLIDDHPILDGMKNPNNVQTQSTFIYTWIVNLLLTGEAYVIEGDAKKNETTGEMEPEFWVLPTAWIVPDHSKGAFAEFRIVDPNKPTADRTPISGDRLRFAHLPDPANPLKGLATAKAQANAVSIDAKIQTSQVAHFDNGIHPSVLITIGRNPFGEFNESGKEGSRPLLTPAQRRQIDTAINKVHAGVHNAGRPAILDGLIENITRFSATSQEMGWEKSEKSVKQRILSAFGVHPFVLGEMAPGSYSQAFVIMQKFYDKVNGYLNTLSQILADFIPAKYGYEDLTVWIEERKAEDKALQLKQWETARKNQDVTQNEFRHFMGLPPDEDSNQQYLDKTMFANAMKAAESVANGNIKRDQAISLLKAAGLPTSISEEIAGPEPTPEEIAARNPPPPPLPGELTDEEAVEEVEKQVRRVQELLVS